jgi:DNA-binding HxlR family transcriptional regulator
MSTHEDAIARTLHLVSGKWKVHILSRLFVAPMRYNDLNRLLPQLSPKVLTQQLHALERDALIYRTYQSVPGKRVNYTITAQGARLWNSLALIEISAEDCDRPAGGAEPVFTSATRVKPRNQFRDPTHIRQRQQPLNLGPHRRNADLAILRNLRGR